MSAAQLVTDHELRVFGRGSADDCPTRVGAPTFAGDFAFVSYSEPGGIIGAYVFERDGEGWDVNEKIHLGYW